MAAEKKRGGWGGARPGAGRKKAAENIGASHVPATKPPIDGQKPTPLEVLQAMMNDASVPVAQRIKAAQAAAPYMHPKIGEGGKKAAAADRAKAVAGKFAAATPPKLVVSNR